jgi:hypothetical protein
MKFRGGEFSTGTKGNFQPELTLWGDPLKCHKNFGHSLRFLKVFLHLLVG